MTAFRELPEDTKNYLITRHSETFSSFMRNLHSLNLRSITFAVPGKPSQDCGVHLSRKLKHMGLLIRPIEDVNHLTKVLVGFNLTFEELDTLRTLGVPSFTHTPAGDTVPPTLIGYFTTQTSAPTGGSIVEMMSRAANKHPLPEGLLHVFDPYEFYLST